MPNKAAKSSPLWAVGLFALAVALGGLGQLAACGAVPTGTGGFTSVPVGDANLPSAPGANAGDDDPNVGTVVPVPSPNTAVGPDEGMALVWSRDQTQCLGALGNAVTAGMPVVQLPCDGSALQQWTWAAGVLRMGNFCMTAGALNAPITFATCDSGNANQVMQHNYGKISFGGGTPQPVTQADGSTRLTLSAANANESADQRVYLLTSTPTSRGFVIRNGLKTSACLAVQDSNVRVLPCASSDTNQRWTFGTGFLRNLGTGTCVTHKGADGPLGTGTCANMNATVDGLWLGSGGDVPGHVPLASGSYPNLAWDPNATDPNAVIFDATVLPGRAWRLGARLP